MEGFATPILFIIHHRIETTQKVFDKIKEIKPRQLFIVVDGPCNKKENEECLSVRKIVSYIDWNCEATYLFRDENLGCRDNVYSGISWFFSKVEQGIILEDDIMVDSSFFPYCEELLIRYKDNPRIGTISGDNFQYGHNSIPYSYYFSKYFHCWGWASWRRVWDLIDNKMTDWPTLRNTNWMETDLPGELAFWNKKLDIVSLGGLDTWDYYPFYCLWKNKILNILPSVNLVSNIGFGHESTHTGDLNSIMSNIPRKSMPFPLVHPEKIERFKEADRYEFQFFKEEKR